MAPADSSPPASGTTRSTRATIETFFRVVWNGRDLKRFDEFVEAEFVSHGTRGTQTRGRDAFRTFTADFLAAVPDYRIELLDVVVEGEKAAVRWICRGTHAGALFGIPATGRPFALTGISIYGVRRGRLTEVWRERDFPATWADLLPDVEFSASGFPTALLPARSR